MQAIELEQLAVLHDASKPEECDADRNRRIVFFVLVEIILLTLAVRWLGAAGFAKELLGQRQRQSPFFEISEIDLAEITLPQLRRRQIRIGQAVAPIGQQLTGLGPAFLGSRHRMLCTVTD